MYPAGSTGARVMHIRLVASLIFVASALPAFAAQESDLNAAIKWSVKNDGSLWVKPHPEVVVPAGQEGVARPMMGNTKVSVDDLLPDPAKIERFPDGQPVPRRNVLDIIWQGGLPSLLTLAVPGPLDLASLTDAENHFRQLKLGLTEHDLLKRVALPPPADLTAPLRTRANLDRLLAVRLCGQRRIKRAQPVLEKIADDEKVDPYLRQAARMSLAWIQGKADVRPARNVAPLRDDLTHIPADYDLLIVSNGHRAPALRRPGYWGYLAGMRLVRQKMEAIGREVNPAVVAGGVYIIHESGEWLYEAARIMGNLQWDRMTIAMKLPSRETPKAPISFVASGRFPADAMFRPGTLKPVEKNGMKYYRREGLTAQVGVSNTRFAYHKNWLPEKKTAASHAAELKEKGLHGRVWLFIHLKNAKAVAALGGPMGAFSTGLQEATLRLTGGGGVSLELKATYETEEQAANATAAFKTMVPAALAAIPFELKDGDRLSRIHAALLRTKISSKGNAATAKVKLTGETPETILEALVTAEPRKRDERAP